MVNRLKNKGASGKPLENCSNATPKPSSRLRESMRQTDELINSKASINNREK